MVRVSFRLILNIEHRDVLGDGPVQEELLPVSP